jgi:maltose O-acetyltransferase
MQVLDIENDAVVGLSQKEKMLCDLHYEHADSQLSYEREKAASLTETFNQTYERDTAVRKAILSKLLGQYDESCEVKPPFRCDYGYNIKLGKRVFINYDCVILDCNQVEIGDDSLLAPRVTITAAYHPTDPGLRLQKMEAAAAVKIGRNVWIGAGAVICQGVTIGDNVTIGAGSVVTKDIPSNVVAVGIPCRVLRHVDRDDGAQYRVDVAPLGSVAFVGLGHINIAVDDVVQATSYYERILGAKPIKQFSHFKNVGFAKSAGFLDKPQDVDVSIVFMQVPQTPLTLELMHYHSPQTQDRRVGQPIGVSEVGGVRHVALAVKNIAHAFEHIRLQKDIRLMNDAPDYMPQKISPITADEMHLFDTNQNKDAHYKQQLADTVGSISYFYFVDKYGVQWEFEQGHADLVQPH